MTTPARENVVKEEEFTISNRDGQAVARAIDPAAPTLRQGVKELSEALLDAMTSSSLQERVDALGVAVSEIERDIKEWQGWRKGPDLESFEGLKSQVEAIQKEWEDLTGTFQTQRERLDLLLNSMPGVVEVSVVKALTLRVEHLEGLVERLLTEGSMARAERATHRQLVVSLAALGITICLWGAWIILALVQG